MSTSKSSFLSRSRLRLSRLLRKPTVHVCGLLGTYNIKSEPTQDDDFWMATDFIALRQLLGARDDLSEWFCGKPIRMQRGFLLGDPACDWIIFNPPAFEKVLDVEPQFLAMSFLFAVSNASSRLSEGDTLVIVLVGHGDDDSHAFVVGDEKQRFELKKEVLELSVRGTKGNILVISTACYSGSWKSTHWTLLAAAGPDQHSVSMAVSGSGECRGFFTNSLVAEHPDEFTVRPPYPGLMDNSGRCLHQRSHNFGPQTSASPSPRQPKRSMQDILDWVYRFRDVIGWTYPSAEIIFHPCQLGSSHHLPFTSLISGKAPFHKLECVGPSPSADQVSIRSANTFSTSPLQNLPSPSRTLSSSEEATLIILATNHLNFMPPTIPSELPTILQCHHMIYGVKRGRDPLSDAKRSGLYSTLTNMAYQRDLALMIAKSLGWERAVAELGGPGGRQSQLDDMVALRREAEASGCLVSILTFPVTPYTRWAGAAGWLARVWEKSGRLIVCRNDWTLAIEQALLSVKK